MVEMVEIYRFTGERASMPMIDAKQACRNHPNEWSRTPWSDAAKARVQSTKSTDELKRLDREKALSDARDALDQAEDSRVIANSKLLTAQERLKKNRNNVGQDEAQEAVEAATAQLEVAVKAFEAARAKMQELGTRD